jgi:hypothetical protein
MYPGDFTEWASKKSGKARLILGKRKGSEEWEVQAIRYPKDQWPESTAQASCQAHDGMFEAAVKVAEHTYGDNGIPEWDEKVHGKLPEAAVHLFTELENTDARTYAKGIKGVEIFSTGTWNGDPYTEDDLDAMVSAFSVAGINPPLKLGHADAQKFFGQKDGAPALGWVERIYRRGKKLLADMKDVPEALYGLIREKKYRKVSAEIYWNFKGGDGTVFPRALKAVALLGADMPAVSNLEDLQAALFGEKGRLIKAYGEEGADVHVHEYEERGDESMDEKTYKDQIAALTTDRDQQKIRADAADKSATDSALRVFSLELDGLVKDGKVLPAEVGGLQTDFLAMGTGLRKYSEGGKEVEKTWGQRKLDELKARPKLVEFKERAGGGESEGTTEDPSVSIGDLAGKIMRERKCSYMEALEVVRVEEPVVFKAYMTKRKEGGK